MNTTLNSTNNPSDTLAARHPRRRIRRLVATALAAATIGGTALALAPNAPAPQAHAAGECFKSVRLVGPTAYGRELYSNDRYVKVNTVADVCLKYAKAYGGYYVYQFWCSTSSSRLVSRDISITNTKNAVRSSFYDQIGCSSTQTWKWDRTWPGDDYTASPSSAATWALDQRTGNFVRARVDQAFSAIDDWFG